MKNTTCLNCGGPLPPKHRVWCAKKKCQKAKDKHHKAKLREYWRTNGGTRRKPIKAIPLNEKPCQLCKRPLGRTVNRFYHPECHRKKSHIEGLDYCAVNTHQRNGHYTAN